MSKSIIVGGKDFLCCSSCLNLEYDPFECRSCVAGSKYQDEQNTEFMTLAELKAMEVME